MSTKDDILFLFTILVSTNLKAIPIHAYYCFNTQQAETIVNIFDEFMASSGSKGASTHRLYAFPLNGENLATHCIVSESDTPDQHEKNVKIFEGSSGGQKLLGTFFNVVEPITEGAGTPIASYGNLDPNKHTVSMLIDLKINNDDEFLKTWNIFVKKNSKSPATLFADYFTGVQGRTHYVVISAESLDDLINNLNSTLGSEEGRMFSLSLRGNREILGRSLINLVKSWEK